MGRSFALTIIVILISNVSIRAQVRELELATQTRVSDLLNLLVKNQDALNYELLRVNLQSLLESSEILYGNLKERGISNEDSLLYNSLESVNQTLFLLSDNFINSEAAPIILDYINQDLKIKINSTNLGIGQNLLTSVKVYVFAKKNNININGYDVSCNFMWDAISGKNAIKFNNPTSDAVKYLSPGYYIFWLSKNGETIKTKIEVEIGNLKEVEESIIFYLD